MKLGNILVSFLVGFYTARALRNLRAQSTKATEQTTN